MLNYNITKIQQITIIQKERKNIDIQKLKNTTIQTIYTDLIVKLGYFKLAPLTPSKILEKP